VTSNDPGTWIDGFSSCLPEHEGSLHLDPTRPVTVLVHGCTFSRGGFRNLAQVFEARGQQTLCFSYDDRESLETSSAQLVAALEALQGIFTGREITLVGHSQGGLVARRALVGDRERPVTIRPDLHLRLVTVSSPFGGIRASSHCGLTWLHAVTLGVTVGVCQAIAGNKWHEIYPGSEFMLRPGKLVPAVSTHVKVVTDERDSCRRYGAKGLCAESDYVFAREEQYGDAVDGDGRVANIEVRAGHIEIVGERGLPPTKLLDLLQRQQILAEEPPGGGADTAALVKRSY
jgi:pimeloyl-ACP methyl ester carboxylesterase